jgi:hypothetical protein
MTTTPDNAIPRLLPLPARLYASRLQSKKQMLDQTLIMAALMRHKLTADHGRALLKLAIKQAIHTGTLPCMRVVEAASLYSVVDMALREVLAEEVDEKTLPTETRASLRHFEQQALTRNITIDRPGHGQDNWARDLGISILMTMVLLRWPHLKKSSRSKLWTRPSASWLVATALERSGVTGSISAQRVVQIYDGLGEITGRLERLIAKA